MLEWYALKPQVRLRSFKGSPLAYCVFAGLCDYAFDNGGLPDSPQKVSVLTDLPIDQIKEVWPQFKAYCELQENGRLMPRDIVAADQKASMTIQKKRDAGRAGGARSGDVRRGQSSITETPVPFDSFEPTPIEPSLADLLTRLFPAETGQRRFLDLGKFVMDARATNEQLESWADWFRFRYPNRAATVFTFKETLSDMLGEPAMLPTGARFIIACSFGLDAKEHRRLTKVQYNLAVNQGSMLDELVNIADVMEWRRLGYLPTKFQQYFRANVKDNGFPSAESVVKHWKLFLKWLPANME